MPRAVTVDTSHTEIWKNNSKSYVFPSSVLGGLVMVNFMCQIGDMMVHRYLIRHYYRKFSKFFKFLKLNVIIYLNIYCESMGG